MSSFTKKIGEDKYYCIDDYFGKHRYGYIKMTQEQKDSENPWSLCNTKESEVLNEEEFTKLIKTLG